MPRVCTICTHPKRGEIDKALIAGQPLRDIAGRFQLSKTAVARHKEHVPVRLIKANEAREVAQADSLVDEIKALEDRSDRLYRISENILAKALQADDLRTALAAIREANNCSREARASRELRAELEGELNRRQQINLLIQPEWAQMRAAFIESLRAWPVAKIAAARVLAELEAKNVTQP